MGVKLGLPIYEKTVFENKVVYIYLRNRILDKMAR
jgi:hypothetical protein